MATNNMQTLRSGTTLHQGSYRIERLLKRGKFTITYLATDVKGGTQVAVKEFFPKDYCERDGNTGHVTLGTQDDGEQVMRMKARFLKKARVIAKADDPDTGKVYAIFEENGTAYYVTDYSGDELQSSDINKRQPAAAQSPRESQSPVANNSKTAMAGDSEKSVKSESESGSSGLADQKTEGESSSVSAVASEDSEHVNKTRKWLIIGFTAVALLLLLYGIFGLLTKSSSSVYDGDSLEEEEEQVASGEINGHEYVDLGLPSGLKWATCNIEAYSSDDYWWCYYAWGDTETKSSYEYNTTLTIDKRESELKSAGIVNSSGNLMMSYDAARANWGSSWRMPTKQELEELVDKCTWEWTSQEGQNGYRVTGPNGKSIFLPAAGRIYYGSSIFNVGDWGYYWSSTCCDDIWHSYNLYFGERTQSKVGIMDRCYGFSVRAVSE